MKKIILDVDTGTDDAVAIMVAILSEDIDVLGICTVNGNRNVELTTENTLRVVEHLGVNIPVYKGCSLPMVSTLLPWRRPSIPHKGQIDNPSEDVHGDYLSLPKATIKTKKENAVIWLINTLLQSNEKITLVPVGPLTNIAMALRIEPKITEKIEKIVIMGGGYRDNNITPAAEFNFWVDPEAAKIVLDSGCDILIVPLDATHAAALSIDDQMELEKVGTKASLAASKIIEQRRIGYNNWQPMSNTDTVPVHDALAVCAVINQDVLKDVVHINVDIDISGGLCDGQSLCDVEHKNKKSKPNAMVALNADKKLFAKILISILSKN